LDEKTKEIVERLNNGGAFKPTATGSYHFIAMNRVELVEAADIITRLSERVEELEQLAKKLRSGLNDEDDIHINREWIRDEVDALLSQEERKS